MPMPRTALYHRSSVPYEKGFALLNELQKRVGKEPFHAFAKEYIKKFRWGGPHDPSGKGGAQALLKLVTFLKVELKIS